MHHTDSVPSARQDIVRNAEHARCTARRRSGVSRWATPRVAARAAVLALAGAALVSFTACEPGERRFLSIGTGGTGGVYYPLGGALASRLSLNDPVRRYTAEVTGGSVENANRLREGQIDLGFVLPLSLIHAYEGGGDYSTPGPELRAVAPTYPNLTHVLVHGSSDATSIADLRGARISVGTSGSGTEQLARQLLEVYGMTYDDIRPRYLSFNESSSALQDGAIDAAIISVGYPAAAVLEATTTGSARLLPLEEDRIQELIARHPYYAAVDIPAGVYPGVDEPVRSTALVTWVAAREDLDDDIVHTILDIFADEREVLERVHPIASQIDLDLLDSPPIPLHPATIRWMEARGR